MTLTLQSTRKLNDGNEIPALGFGVYQSEPGDETEQAVLLALEVNWDYWCTEWLLTNVLTRLF